MTQESSGIEKRRHKRLLMKVKILYRIKAPPVVIVKVGNREIEAAMQDISQGGIGLLTNYDIPQGTVLDIKFSLVDVDSHHPYFSLHGPINLTGEVKYNKSLPRNQHFLGIAFTRIEHKDEAILINFVNTLLSSGPII